MTFVVRQIAAIETQPVRHAVLWPHKPTVASCVIPGDDAPSTLHFGAFAPSGSLVGVCSVFDERSGRFPNALPLSDRVVRLRVMGTLPSVRGKGAGEALIQTVLDAALKRGAAWVWCDAREVAFGFYLRLGFSFHSKVYNVPEIGTHRMMARRVET